MLSLFGICLFRTWLFRPLLIEAATAPLDAKLTGVLRSLASVAFASGLLWLVLTAGNMAGRWQDGLDPQTLRLVLNNTFFGQVWSGHLLLCALLLISVGWRRCSSANLRLALTASLLATLAPVGHGAMFDGLSGELLILNQLIHLCCVGAWLGGLLLLSLLLAQPSAGNAQRLLRRFSGIGYGLVAAIIITGLINVRVMSGAPWPEPAFSGFGLILLIKVCLVLCMLLLALFNRLLLNSKSNRLNVLRASVALECLLGMAAVAAVSLLGTLPPMLTI
jgi:putative copper resistance protein D